METKIEGVTLHKLQQFHDERGKVMHMLREDDPHFQKFGEIYFSCTYPNVVKAWHKHSEMTLNYAAIVGGVKVVLFDDRERSSSLDVTEEHYLSPENYYLLTVPPGIWNGFKAIGAEMAIVANCATISHRSDEINRLPFNDKKIGYDWQLSHY